MTSKDKWWGWKIEKALPVDSCDFLLGLVVNWLTTVEGCGLLESAPPPLKNSLSLLVVVPLLSLPSLVLVERLWLWPLCVPLLSSSSWGMRYPTPLAFSKKRPRVPISSNDVCRRTRPTFTGMQVPWRHVCSISKCLLNNQLAYKNYALFQVMWTLPGNWNSRNWVSFSTSFRLEQRTQLKANSCN